MEENPLLNVRLNCRWCIVENAKIFWSYVKNFWNLPWVRNEGPRLLNANKFSSIFQSNFLTTINLPIKLLDNHQSSNQTSWQPSIFQSSNLVTASFLEVSWKSLQMFEKFIKRLKTFTWLSVVRSEHKNLAAILLSILKISKDSVSSIQDGLFRGCSRMGRGGKKTFSLNSVTHILQWWNLAQLYLT